jgi:predicted N-acetyltransferase YhbS
MALCQAMETVLREATLADVDECGRICFEAFRKVAEDHGFPPDFPSAEAGAGVVGFLVSNPGFWGVVAEVDGRVVGSNFLDERSTIAGLGPITVDPAAQNAQVGKALMVATLDRARARGFAGVRLLQAAYHNRSLSLYAKLGFDVREPCVTMQGPPVDEAVPGFTVRSATAADLAACNRVCFGVHGHDRSGELLDAIGQGSARVVERDGRITGYTSGTAFLGHTVGESNAEIKALIGSAVAYDGPGILVPARNGELYRWCMSRGLRVVHVMTLMTVGLYNEPAGAYLPSVLY